MSKTTDLFKEAWAELDPREMSKTAWLIFAEVLSQFDKAYEDLYAAKCCETCGRTHTSFCLDCKKYSNYLWRGDSYINQVNIS